MAYTDHLTALPNRATLFQEMAAPLRRRRAACWCSTSTGSRPSTTSPGTRPATSCWSRSPAGCTPSSGTTTWSPAWAATSSPSWSPARSPRPRRSPQRVVDVLGMPHRASDWTFAVGASVGVAELSAAGGQIAFREADEALRVAKQAGKGCVPGAPTTTPRPSSSRARTTWRRVVDEGVAELRLDAACDADGRIALVHAVPVWQHAVHGTVRGRSCGSAAERQGLLRRACSAGCCTRRARRSRRCPTSASVVAVSLPAGHVTPDGLAAEVAAALETSGSGPVAPDPVLHRGDAADLVGRPRRRARRPPRDRRPAVPGQLRHGPQPLRAAGPGAARPGARRPDRAGRPRRHRPGAAGARHDRPHRHRASA